MHVKQSIAHFIITKYDYIKLVYNQKRTFSFIITKYLCALQSLPYSWDSWLLSSAWMITNGLYRHFTFHWTFNGVRISLSDGLLAFPGSCALKVFLITHTGRKTSDYHSHTSAYLFTMIKQYTVYSHYIKSETYRICWQYLRFSGIISKQKICNEYLTSNSI